MIRVSIVLAIMAVLATSAYAFTAANNVPASSAGFGGAAISGYDVSDIHYTLGEGADCESVTLPNDENNYGNCVTQVAFTLAGTNAPTNVSVHFEVPDFINLPPHQYSVTGGECSIANGSSAGTWDVSCNIREFAASIEFLRIAAAQ
jgi:hypothetical protein